MRGVAGGEGGGVGGVRCAEVREREMVDVRQDEVREGDGVEPAEARDWGSDVIYDKWPRDDPLHL